MEKHLKEIEAQQLLGEDWELLTSKAPQSHFMVSEQALRRGALLLPTQKLASLTVAEVTIIDGDLELSGVLELKSGAALFVRGDVKAHDIAANGSLYVLGALTVSGFFFGAEDTGEAIICKEPQIDTLLLHNNYLYLERGKRFGSHSAKRRISSEKDGFAALREAITSLGHRGLLNVSEVTQFLRMRARWGVSPQSLAPKKPSLPAKPAANKLNKKTSKKSVTKKPSKTSAKKATKPSTKREAKKVKK
jgi:hypothetical protein